MWCHRAGTKCASIYSNLTKTVSFKTWPTIPQYSRFSTATHLHNSFNIQDEADFDDRVNKSEVPVIVDFHAKWCGPCKMLGPRLEAVIESHKGKVLLAKIDIDENQDLALDHGVEAVPTVLAVKKGSVVNKFVGLLDEDQLEAFVGKLVV